MGYTTGIGERIRQGQTDGVLGVLGGLSGRQNIYPWVSIAGLSKINLHASLLLYEWYLSQEGRI
jgi:hypothetical protein